MGGGVGGGEAVGPRNTPIPRIGTKSSIKYQRHFPVLRCLSAACAAFATVIARSGIVVRTTGFGTYPFGSRALTCAKVVQDSKAVQARGG